VLHADLKTKHAAMAEDVFPFLRATFYRWMQLGRKCARRRTALQRSWASAISTSRTLEPGAMWKASGMGINDFDEAYNLPYTQDLVRLAASAHIAVRESRLQIAPKDACNSILAGYQKSLESGGHPIVLAEEHPCCDPW